MLNRAFYALKDAKTAMVNGSIAVVLNIGLAIVLVRYMGIGGLALGSSISGIVAMVSLHRKIGDFGMRGIVLTLVKVVGVAVYVVMVLRLKIDEVGSLSRMVRERLGAVWGR